VVGLSRTRGIEGALAKHAEAVFSTLQPHEQKAFPLVMRYLVTLGQGEEEVPNRRTVPYRDFVASEGTDRDRKAGAKGFVIYSLKNDCWSQIPIRRERLP
jgi:hypothetical protein